LTYCSQ